MKRARVRHVSDGFWVIDWPGVSVPMEVPWPLPSPSAYDELARDIFLQEYTPALGDVVVDVGAGVGWELNLFSRLVGSSGSSPSKPIQTRSGGWSDGASSTA